MVLTFLQAKQKVSPNKPVQPGSAEHLEIIELMKQSGHVFASENVPAPPPPPARTIQDLKPYRERETPTIKPKIVSKRDWLSLPSNRKAYDDHIAKNATVPIGSLEPPPQHLSWKDKTAPKTTGKISKREWVAQLK